MMRPICIIFCLLVGLASAQPTPADLLATAEAAFDRVESKFQTDPVAARAGLDEAIAAYRALIENGTENAAVHRNIGTAFMLKGDTSRAIVSYRRADRLDPTDHRVRDSLAAARALVRSEVTQGPRSRVENAVLFWRGLIPRNTMLTVGLVGWAIAWIAAAARIISRRGATLVITGSAIAILTIGSLIAERSLHQLNPAAVIVQDNVIGRRGPSESVYETTFDQPIRAGVEATIIEHREGWTRLRLRSGAETWVRSGTIEQI